ncbi:SDR family oxidoreductase [Algoriphagus zhangzhouensis]|uniref:NAD(P)H dehydrogenase (Quinone) n=1 Tax=Algoriphagus zhangzhouensis TaxID=1073327 RepID=A0A1M7ZI14_9BACT|nr:SDR family oxidoreductase [Algoriphagus zhangzhouensis]TDY44296.1 NAD(P)H dehydrogenase (quinone) [Algoriphagus zhangzhouensis]SHO64517.1 NAD(P)H dehydrogenase (quinone) [Algoriphagus zhangzhouensis]
MKIGITGATGQLGSLVIEHLKSKTASENIVALVRNQEKAAGLGVESRSFDYNDAETLKQSLSGIDYLLLISSSEVGQRARQHKNVIEAAKEAGVKWIVYTSLLHADTSSLSLAGEHLETEALLKDAGIPVTILRNGWYTENYLGSVDSALKAGAFIGSAGEGKISSAARNDFAEAAAVVISDPKHQGKVYELAGDESYTLSDLAKEISKQAGKEIPYNNLEEAQYAEILESVGLPAEFAQAIAGWDVSASKGDLFDNSKTLSELIQRPTTPMRESVAQTLN